MNNLSYDLITNTLVDAKTLYVKEVLEIKLFKIKKENDIMICFLTDAQLENFTSDDVKLVETIHDKETIGEYMSMVSKFETFH